MCKILFRSFTLIFQRDVSPNVFRRGNDFENRVRSRSTYPTLIERRPRYRRKEDTRAPSHSLPISFSFHEVELPSCPPTNPVGKLGAVWPPLSIQFSPSWRSRCQESRPTDRPTGRFVFSRLSRERKMMEVAYGKRDGKKKRKESRGKRGKKKCALFARTDFLELLMARDSEG